MDELEKKRKFINENILSKDDSLKQIIREDLEIIRKSLKDDYFKRGLENIDMENQWTVGRYTTEFDRQLEEFLLEYKRFYQDAYNKAVAAREQLIYKMENDKATPYDLNNYKNQYYNESLADLVKNVSTKNRILEYKGELIQQINPIFLDPKNTGTLNYRAHFFAPKKNMFNKSWDTYWFNILVIWFMAAGFYITLYFEWLRKFIDLFGKVNLPKKK